MSQQDIAEAVQGKWLKNYPLAKHTSWRVGGVADHCYFPKDLDDLVACFRHKSLVEPYYWLGLGSNVLIRDGGLRGTVIITLGGIDAISFKEDGEVYVQAGVTCAKMARLCAQHGLTNAAFFAGIPGTIGGAIVMNAGAFGGETWSHCLAVQMLDCNGNLSRHEASDFNVGYREVAHDFDGYVVGAWFRFPEGDVSEEKRRIKSLLKKRNQSQPIGLPSCGSVFRNPPGDYAARLIESCDLKGVRIGGAVVSEKHANFIISDASCTSADIEALMAHIMAVVQEKTQVVLVPEVHVIGESND